MSARLRLLATVLVAATVGSLPAHAWLVRVDGAVRAGWLAVDASGDVYVGVRLGETPRPSGPAEVLGPTALVKLDGGTGSELWRKVVENLATFRLTPDGDAVVLAVPHFALPGLLPDGVVDPEAMAELGTSPIVNVHVHFDRCVLFEPFAAALDSPVQWLFDRTSSSGVETGQLVSVSLSGAEQELAETQDEIVERVRPALELLLPAARSATVLDASVTKEPRATFRPSPGTRALRPGTRTSLAGVFLAGAWTDTGWPATMEGAVRSGVAAAEAALAQPRGTARTRSVEAAA